MLISTVWQSDSVIHCMHVCSVTQSYPTLCNPVDCSPPGSSVHGILQARILEWVAILSSRGSSQSRDQTCVSCVFCIGRWIPYHWTTRDAIHTYILYVHILYMLYILCTILYIYIYIHSFLGYFPLLFITGYWIQFFVLFSRTLLFISLFVKLFWTRCLVSWIKISSFLVSF